MLVHCAQGKSRSTTVVLAYLCLYPHREFGASVPSEATFGRNEPCPNQTTVLWSDGLGADGAPAAAVTPALATPRETTPSPST